VILEDHPLVPDAHTESRVLRCEDIEITYRGGDLDEALGAVATVGTDCVVLDLDLDHLVSPILTIASLVDTGAPVLVVGDPNDAATVRAALAAGVRGYVRRGADGEEVQAALTTVLAGGTYLSPEAAAAVEAHPRSPVGLSEQERRALVLYASGLTMRSVARHLGVSESTAREYISRVRAKYGKAGTRLSSKTDLYRMAQREGLLP